MKSVQEVNAAGDAFRDYFRAVGLIKGSTTQEPNPFRALIGIGSPPSAQSSDTKTPAAGVTPTPTADAPVQVPSPAMKEALVPDTTEPAPASMAVQELNAALEAGLMAEAPPVSLESTLNVEAEPDNSANNSPPRNGAVQPAEPPAPEAIASAKYQEMVEALENPKEALSSSEKWQIVRAALNLIYADLVSNLRPLAERANRFYEAAPAEYARWIRCSLRSGLGLATVVAPIPPRLAQNTALLLRPQLVGELQLETLAEELQLDAALGQYAEYLRLTFPVKLFNSTGRVPTDKQAISHTRITTGAQSCLRFFDATIERLRTRNQRRFPAVHISAEGVAVQVNGFDGQSPAQAEDIRVTMREDQLDSAEPV